MGGYLRSTLRFFALITVAWFVLGLIGGIWPFLGAPFAAPLILLGVPALLLALLIGTVIWLKRGIRMASPLMPQWRRIFLIGWVPALCVVTFLAMGPLISLGSYSGAHVRLTANHQKFEAIVAKVRKERSTAGFVNHGVGYFVFSGSSVHIQFADMGDIHSMFGNIEFYEGEPARPDRSEADGCRHLSGNYYLCWLDL